MLQVYVKEKRKSRFAVSTSTDIQAAGTTLYWLGRTNWPARVERGLAAQSPRLEPTREGSKRPRSRAPGVGTAPLSQNSILYRSLEKVDLKPNLFYWQRPWAFSARTAPPRGRPPSRLTTLGSLGLPLQPLGMGTLRCILTHT